MKPLNLSFLFCFWIIAIYAQNSKITYRETYSLPILDLRVEEHILMYNQNRSLYLQVKTNSERTEKTTRNDDGTLTVIFNLHPGIPKFVYKDLAENKFIFKGYAGSKMLTVNEEPFKIDWKLHNETKKIGNYNAQKATTTFRGRNYTAWFAPDIPTPFGPWKLTGLSGLILEANEDSGIYKVEAIEVSINIENNDLQKNLNELKFDKAVSLKEYVKTIYEEDALSEKQWKAKLPRGIEVTGNSKDKVDPKTYMLEIFNEF